ncbi:SH3 domain-containing protein [Bacillus sp. D386]|uniref:SH3 domain-containing protein n=1 Tax=Bacillus sp. D386 TaxID=2587155 RepID=UPI00112404FE|nr:SH3 domain-containing protein [Bacillus sp. D386]
MRKLSIKAVSLLIMLSFFITMLPEKADAASYSSKVNASTLNVRSKPSTKSSIVGKIKKGKVVTVQSEQNNWSKITYDKKTGWVSSSYLTYVSWTGYAGTDNLSIKQTASSSAKSLATIKKGIAVSVKGQKGNWLKVYYSSKKVTGWVPASSVTKTKPTTATANLGTYYVTATSLNVRASASTSSNVITTVKKNAAVTLQQKSGSWGKIRTSNGKVGWVSLSYISTKKPVTSTNLGTYYVTATSLNVRASASTSSKVITTVKKNAAVTLQQKSGSWGKIKTSNGKVGWVAMQYISTKKAELAAIEYLYTTANTSLYKEADSKSTILASVAKNTSVIKLTTKGNFTQVKLTSGLIGWIPSQTLVYKSVKEKIIVIDPGHGGSETGAIGVKLKIMEKDINLSTANQLATLLKNAGATVIMTRSNDTVISLEDRAALSNSKKADAFLSIHYNNAPNVPSASGIETFYHHNSTLANAIHGELIKATGLKNRKVKYGNYRVIRDNKQPAALLELGFLSNAAEEKTISQTSYHKKAAQGILNGLNVYFKNK